MEIKIPGVRKLRERIDRGNPLWAATQEPRRGYYHEQFTESSFSASYSKWDDDHDWSSQEWKTDTEMVRTIGETRCNLLESDTRIPTWFLS